MHYHMLHSQHGVDCHCFTILLIPGKHYFQLGNLPTSAPLPAKPDSACACLAFMRQSSIHSIVGKKWQNFTEVVNCRIWLYMENFNYFKSNDWRSFYWVWWYTPMILALGRWHRRTTTSSSLAWTTQQDPILHKKQNRNISLLACYYYMTKDNVQVP